jgi:hypothetical protein
VQSLSRRREKLPKRYTFIKHDAKQKDPNPSTRTDVSSRSHVQRLIRTTLPTAKDSQSVKIVHDLAFPQFSASGFMKRLAGLPVMAQSALQSASSEGAR